MAEQKKDDLYQKVVDITNQYILGQVYFNDFKPKTEQEFVVRCFNSDNTNILSINNNNSQGSDFGQGQNHDNANLVLNGTGHVDLNNDFVIGKTIKVVSHDNANLVLNGTGHVDLNIDLNNDFVIGKTIKVVSHDNATLVLNGTGHVTFVRHADLNNDFVIGKTIEVSHDNANLVLNDQITDTDDTDEEGYPDNEIYLDNEIYPDNEIYLAGNIPQDDEYEADID